jgi:hypothetical protein
LKHMFKFEKNDIFLKKRKFSFQYLKNDPLNVLELIVDIVYG